ncbi:MAG: hypothetical protein KDA93_04570 [Planctomycetaceae bacterium]|nr:hypothetical protein [Planctomycetaceae bacterium]
MHPKRYSPMLKTTFVDEDVEQRNAGLLVAAVIAFVISGWYSFNELKYALRSTTVTATVTRQYEFTVPTRHGQSGPRLGIEYEFTNAAGDTQHDKDWVPLPSELEGQPSVEVQYLPSTDGDSRLAANRSVIGPVFFGGCLLFLAFSLAQLIREANAPIRRSRR